MSGKFPCLPRLRRHTWILWYAMSQFTTNNYLIPDRPLKGTVHGDRCIAPFSEVASITGGDAPHWQKLEIGDVWSSVQQWQDQVSAMDMASISMQ